MNLWDQILARVETKVNRHSFYTWFKPTSFIAQDTKTISVRVPDALFKTWLTKHYSGVIGEAMSEIKRANLAIDFVTDTQSDGAAIPLSPEEAVALESVPAPLVRRAAMLSGNLGRVAVAALAGGAAALSDIGLEVGRGVLPMLAAGAPDVATALADTGVASVE